MKRKKILSWLGFLAVGYILSFVLSAGTYKFALAESQDMKEGSLSIENAVIHVADTAGQAVVSISTEHTTRIRGGQRYYFRPPSAGSPFPEDEFFRRFFDDFFGEAPDREYKSVGLGSGVIIDTQGYVLTNEHVISDADKITVTLPDGRDFKGEVKGTDPRSDLAVIKINARNLPVAPLGDSDSLKIGQWVVAIGNPFGFAMQSPEPTVTVGVISALHRSLGSMLSRDRDYNDLIQTDAAINPGNSGGPLVNLKGEIVGINVAIFSTSGGYQGVGFAIPVNSARRIISRLIEGKKIMYGWLGVQVQNLTQDMAQHLRLADKNGTLVARVFRDSPAKAAGIKEGDVIKIFDNQPVANVKELITRVSKTEVGRRVKVVVVRDKKERNLTVKISARPESLEEAEAGYERLQTAENWRGLKVEDTKENKGVAVVHVEPNSPAEEAGLLRGEVICEINKRPISGILDFNKVAKDLKGNALIKTRRGYFLVKGEE
ncbi:MAG: Do family serine endopeptidase [Candidatus Omnitrophota bacterium]